MLTNKLVENYGYVKSYRCDSFIIFGLRFKGDRGSDGKPNQIDEYELNRHKIMDFWFALLENNQLVFYQANGDRLPGGTFDLKSLAGVDLFADEDIVSLELNGFWLPHEPTTLFQAFQGVVSVVFKSVFRSSYQVDFDFTSSLQYGYTIKFKEAKLIGRNQGRANSMFKSDEDVKLAEAFYKDKFDGGRMEW